jgi:hypothetical protein
MHLRPPKSSSLFTIIITQIQMVDTDRSRELESAASDITPETLEAAKSAIAFCCEEHLRWSGIFLERLETVPAADLHRFTRALALTMLGHLPTRPATCPFCIQYGRDRECRGCGYGETHGRCDLDDSAFSRFIEAFQDLGTAIYQDLNTGGLQYNPIEARSELRMAISKSAKLAGRMQQDLPRASALRLMELKACYLDKMMELIPAGLSSAEAREKLREVKDTLKNYW